MNPHLKQLPTSTHRYPSAGAAARSSFSWCSLLACGGLAALLMLSGCSGGPGLAAAPDASASSPARGSAPITRAVVGPVAPPDADLAELRRLAVDAPLAELLQHRLVFMFRLSSEYHLDPVLWSGVQRLCDAVLAGEPIEDRRLFARLLAQTIEKAQAPFAAALLSRIPELRKVT